MLCIYSWVEFWYFRCFSTCHEWHLVFVFFILLWQGLFNRVEFNQACQNGWILVKGYFGVRHVISQIACILIHFQQSLIQSSVIHLMLHHERLKIIVHLMKEYIYLIDLRSRSIINSLHFRWYHIGKLLFLQFTFFQNQVDLIEYHLACFNHLFMWEHEIFVHSWHSEIWMNKFT